MTGDLEYLRTTLRSGILSTLAANWQQAREGHPAVRDGAGVSAPRGRPATVEREMLVGVLAGPRSPESWLGGGERMDFFDAKGVVEMLMGRLRLPCSFQSIEDATFLPGRCAAVLAGDAVVGVVGEVHPRTLEHFEIEGEGVALLELDVDALARAVSTEPVRYRPIARYPGALRDLAVVLDAGIPAAQVQAIIEREALVSHATLFDVYEGAGVASGKRSLAYRVLFQAPDRTLVGDEVSQAMAGYCGRAGARGWRHAAQLTRPTPSIPLAKLVHYFCRGRRVGLCHVRSGNVAQRQSGRFISARSQVRIPPLPPSSPLEHRHGHATDVSRTEQDVPGAGIP